MTIVLAGVTQHTAYRCKFCRWKYELKDLKLQLHIKLTFILLFSEVKKRTQIQSSSFSIRLCLIITAGSIHMILNGHLGHEHCPDYPDDRLEEAKEPGAKVPLREGLPAILFFTSETQT